MVGVTVECVTVPGRYTCTVVFEIMLYLFVHVYVHVYRIQAYMLADIVVAIPAVDLAVEAVV